MKKQKSNLPESSVLYLVPTTIGNFDDMTNRAVEVLKKVDYIFAEDTRVTKVLLSHFNIITPLHSYHVFNEKMQTDKIIELLQQGKQIALVSDAGLPGISDPGYFATRRVLDSGFSVIALPGANAALTALVASGLPSNRFYFFGFLSHKKNLKKKELEKIADLEDTIIFYEAPHRLLETLELIHLVLGNREIVIARELTKKHEEYIRGKVKDIIAGIDELKGEIVIIVKGAEISQAQQLLNKKSISEHYQYYLDLGNESMKAIKQVAKDRGVAKNFIYKEIHKNI
ncbi:MAG: 16S rRNA (cytidine(1402)-2'-O)-methyltransferase [Bacilli bacterium]|nr:16S rRNA (cytidine(1402)-2'-O)-methyltransferase [Bacilli bacterium]